MPVLKESAITLDFPDNNFFRFADCAAYTALSGNYFKEMDACWFDLATDFCWLIELKDYALTQVTRVETIEQKSWDITKKAMDTFCMFLACKHSYPYGKNIELCLPKNALKNSTQFRFMTIVHCKSAQKPDIQLLNEKFKRKFKPYADLFGIRYYAVVEHSVASKILPSIIQ